jgi:alpha-mannosidase
VAPLLRQGVDAGRLPEPTPLLEQSRPDAVEITAIKRQAERGTLIVRLCNLLREPVHESLRTGPPLRAAWRGNLLEERQEELSVEDHRLALELRGAEILTVELELASPSV